MRPSSVPLCILLLGLSACRYAAWVPTLPAHHGQLSYALAHHQRGGVGEPLVYQGEPIARRNAGPASVVSPSEAHAIFTEAAQVLAGKPTEEQVRQAYADISATCEQTEFSPACDYLREKFVPPSRYAGLPFHFPDEVHREGTVVMVVLDSIIGTDGRPRDIQVVESATKELTGIVRTSLASMRFYPATLAGHPIEIRYTVHAASYSSAMRLTPQQELVWGQVRTQTFPKSLDAWAHLARVLARDNPKDPGYEHALRELNYLSPKYWWSATELAWLYVEGGRYEEAAPLARMGRRYAPENAYVLETSARVAFHQNRCQEAVLEQQQAITKLPEAWPRDERARFERTLADYQRQCVTRTSPVRDGSVPGT